MKNSNWKQHVLLAALTLAALFGGSGCTRLLNVVFGVGVDQLELMSVGFVVRCGPNPDPNAQSGAARGINYSYVEGTLSSSGHPIAYLQSDDCEPSANDDARANTISQFFSGTGLNGGGGSPQRLDVQTPVVSFQDRYPVLSPLPFPPAFSPTLLASYPRASCTPNTNFYVVHHFSNLVSRYSACPLALAKRIMVGSNPLQLAMTPDAKTLIVTRYDSAVVFIDVATDAITTTLSTPGAYPTGIAISPDGSTAYVTSYVTM